MKLITAVIQPSKLDDLLKAVKAAGVTGMTVSEVQGFGRQAGVTEVYRGAEYTTSFIPKVKVEIVVESYDAVRIIDAHEPRDVEIFRAAVTEMCRSVAGADGEVAATEREMVTKVVDALA